MLSRRGFLGLLGLGAAGIAAGELIEPVRKLWFVGSTAPVGSRIERYEFPAMPSWTPEDTRHYVQTNWTPHDALAWNGGYRASDFDSYLKHADAHRLALSALMVEEAPEVGQRRQESDLDWQRWSEDYKRHLEEHRLYFSTRPLADHPDAPKPPVTRWS
jgi:hypothetical protein